MAIKDIRSNLQNTLVDVNAISTDTTTNTNGFDTSHYDMGFYFAFEVQAYTDGTYNIHLEESDDDVTYTDVPSAAILGTSPVTLSAVTADGGTLNTLGAFSNKQYVRAAIVSTSTSTGATIRTLCVAHGENLPV